MELLSNGLKQLGLDGSDGKIELLGKYIKEIEMWNPRYGLVNASGDTLIIKHILDSLAGVKSVSDLGGTSFADVGSGAGLPGIPLAIMLPEKNFTLIDRSGKRIRFLRNVVAMLNLKNVTVLESDLKDVKERFDVITFRAFKPVEPVIMGLLMNILSQDGYLAAYKGRKDVVNEEIALVKDLAEVRNIIELNVPGLGDERNLVLYQKRNQDA